MNSEEIIKLYKGIKGMPTTPSVAWKRAFEFHGEKTGSPLSMSCAPCYLKVRAFIASAVEHIQKANAEQQ